MQPIKYSKGVLGFGCVCKKVNMFFIYFWNKMMLKIKVHVNALERCFLG
jgi:hypothetical protein